MPTSDAQKRAKAKWDAANMKIVACNIRREKAEAFKAACNANGTNPAAVLAACIDDYLDSHPAPTAPEDQPEEQPNDPQQ